VVKKSTFVQYALANAQKITIDPEQTANVKNM